jgi:hypothetical protein
MSRIDRGGVCDCGRDRHKTTKLAGWHWNGCAEITPRLKPTLVKNTNTSRLANDEILQLNRDPTPPDIFAIEVGGLSRVHQ